MAPQLPKLAFELVTSNNGRGYLQESYAKAWIKVYSLATYSGNSEIYTTQMFEFETSTCLVCETDTPSNIQPAAFYQHTERWAYREWYGIDVKVSSSLWCFEHAGKAALEVVKKIEKAKEEYNLPYRYKDPLELTINALLKAGYRQIYKYRGKWYLNDAGTFHREDREHDREPSDYTYAVYPWTIQPAPAQIEQAAIQTEYAIVGA